MKLELLTKRLRLIPLANDDVDLGLEMFTDPEVVKYAGGVVGADEIRKGMSKWTKRGGNGCIGIWCISDRDTGDKYGSAALLPIPIDEDDTDFSLVIPGIMPDGEIEIGYFLKRSAWGNGYATEACKRLIRFAFQETPIDKVVATFDDANAASKHVLNKAGFIDRGRMQCYGEDSPIYRITRDEWNESVYST
jgi:RimJ/RimL family protein N-acetyltransferase